MGLIEWIKRGLTHAWLDAVSSQNPLPFASLERLGQHVKASEQGHSGEIRVYIETALPWSTLKQNVPTLDLTRQRAIDLFSSQRVWDTAQNNGVLVYLLLAEHAIEIVADRGMSQRVDPTVWQAMVARLSERCRQGAFESGVMQTVSEVSALLAQHFPLRVGEHNPNELPDFPDTRHR